MSATPYVPVPHPPCVNKRAGGLWCGECAFCFVRVCGEEWWLLPEAALQARMAAAPRSEEEAATRKEGRR